MATPWEMKRKKIKNALKGQNKKEDKLWRKRTEMVTAQGSTAILFVGANKFFVWMRATEAVAPTSIINYHTMNNPPHKNHSSSLPSNHFSYSSHPHIYLLKCVKVTKTKPACTCWESRNCFMSRWRAMKA